MTQQAAALVEAGSDGIVTGVLTPEGDLDTAALSPICQAAKQAAQQTGRPVALALHRAFDVCRDPFAALETACQLGFDTILTSGQAASAAAGASLIAALVHRAAGRIEILAGAGITPDNLPALVKATGAHAYHLSGKKELDSRMQFRREGVPMGLRAFPNLWSGRPTRTPSAGHGKHWNEPNKTAGLPFCGQPCCFCYANWLIYSAAYLPFFFISSS